MMQPNASQESSVTGNKPAFPSGTKLLPPKLAAERFSRGKTWVWEMVRNDPAFPKPIYLGEQQPYFIEAEIDAYIAKLAEARRTQVRPSAAPGKPPKASRPRPSVQGSSATAAAVPA